MTTQSSQAKQLPANGVFLSTTQIDRAVEEIHAFILKNATDKILLVPVLDGALPLFIRLASKFGLGNQSPDYVTVCVQSYGDGLTAGDLRMVKPFEGKAENWKDYTVVVIDDIYDRGLTSRYVVDHLKKCGFKPDDILFVSLLNRHFTGEFSLNGSKAFSPVPTPDYWYVGFGMDEKRKKRLLPYILAQEAVR